jgi:hypothetical protein
VIDLRAKGVATGSVEAQRLRQSLRVKRAKTIAIASAVPATDHCWPATLTAATASRTAV